MKYRCLKNETWNLNGYSISAIREEDIFKIKNWRNEQLNILRQKAPLTDAEQQNYYLTQILPSYQEREPKNILVSFFKNDVLIGYGGLVHIDWEAKRGEISFILETKRTQDIATHVEDFSYFLKLLKVLSFEDLTFNKIHTEVYDIRPYHIQVLEKEGFLQEGCFKKHIMIDGKLVNILFHACYKK